jgi:hypothetical protein
MNGLEEHRSCFFQVSTFFAGAARVINGRSSVRALPCIHSASSCRAKHTRNAVPLCEVLAGKKCVAACACGSAISPEIITLWFWSRALRRIAFCCAQMRAATWRRRNLAHFREYTETTAFVVCHLSASHSADFERVAVFTICTFQTSFTVLTFSLISNALIASCDTDIHIVAT